MQIWKIYIYNTKTSKSSSPIFSEVVEIVMPHSRHKQILVSLAPKNFPVHFERWEDLNNHDNGILIWPILILEDTWIYQSWKGHEGKGLIFSCYSSQNILSISCSSCLNGHPLVGNENVNSIVCFVAEATGFLKKYSTATIAWSCKPLQKGY